jgi:hypothetical protein
MWPLVALGVVGALLPGVWKWTAGFFAGVVLAMWVVLRDDVPPHIRRWLDGAEGEKWTARELRPLRRDGWVVEHDLPAGTGNIDHLLVGPAGVFLLDSKNWFGEVEIRAGVATVTPKDNPAAASSWTGLGPAIRGASAAQARALQAATGLRVWVEPVVVVWAPFEQGCATSHGVTYVHGAGLREWLRGRPGLLAPREVAELGQAIRSRYSAASS